MRLKHLLFIASIVIVGFAVLATSDSDDDADAKAFEKYKQEYNKTYGGGSKNVKGSAGNSSNQQESQAYKNFKKNHQRVQAHNSQPDRTYDQKTNENDDKSDEEKNQHYKGSVYVSVDEIAAQHKAATNKSSKSNGKNVSYKSPAHANVGAAVDRSKLHVGDSAINNLKAAAVDNCATACKILPSMDLRPNMSVVKDQLSCAANYAMTPIALLESEARVNKSSKCFSDQNIVDCNKYADKCAGGDPISSLYWMIVRGVPFQGDYLYTGKNQTCRNVTTQYTKAKNICYYAGNETMIVQIMNRYARPLIAYLATAKSGFMNYAGGIFSDSKCSKNISYSDVTVTSKFESTFESLQ